MDPRSSQNRSSGPGAQGVKSGALNSQGGNYKRGESTDVSSIPKSIPKSNSGIDSQNDMPYVHIKLTKEVLHQFEELTRMSSSALIQEYLNRCNQEQGEIEGLLPTHSSGDDDDTDSDESSDDSYD